MKNILAWFNAKRWRLSLSHCAEGLIIQVPMTLLFGPWVGAISVVVWYYSRKKLEMELKGGRTSADPTATWAVGYLPWTWPIVYVYDVVFPAITSFSIAYLLSQ